MSYVSIWLSEESQFWRRAKLTCCHRTLLASLRPPPTRGNAPMAARKTASRKRESTAAMLEKPPERDAHVKNPILVRERRAALARAAVDVFAAKGYHAARVADVAEAAGIAPGTVYNYVGSKEDLLHMVVEDHLYGYERIVSEAMAGIASPQERLETLLRATVEAIF